MKIALSWLNKYVDTRGVDTILTIEKISETLTNTGLEVESIMSFESIKGGFNGLVVGKVIECKQHPNADLLKITKVDIGEDIPLSIVCGAKNIAKDQHVIVARINTTLYARGDAFKIKKNENTRGNFPRNDLRSR